MRHSRQIHQLNRYTQGLPLSDQAKLIAELKRIADALERLAGPVESAPDFDAAHGFVWAAEGKIFHPVPNISAPSIALLKGIETQKETLLTNTRRFALGHPANNALLWGARGMGKSSLVKAVQGAVASEMGAKKGAILKLLEIHREEIATLPQCLDILRSSPYRFIIFCDDLSFDHDDTTYKSLKAVLEGGIEGRPDNVIFYATSNRRHLMPRDMVENERGTAIHPSEAVNEKVSLSDRFGLWIGFHNCSQDDYLDMVRSYIKHYKLGKFSNDIEARARAWTVTRGARSGRVAWQFIQDLAGEQGTRLDE